MENSLLIVLADTRDKEVKGGAENLSKSAIMVYFELQNRVRAKTCVSAPKRRVSELKSQLTAKVKKVNLASQVKRIVQWCRLSWRWADLKSSRSDVWELQRFLLSSSKLGEASWLFWFCGGLEEPIIAAASTTDAPEVLHQLSADRFSASVIYCTVKIKLAAADA